MDIILPYIDNGVLIVYNDSEINKKLLRSCHMEGMNVKVRAMDDLGRILIPRKFMELLGWDVGSGLSGTVDDIAKTITLTQGSDIIIDDLGRVVIGKQTREQLGFAYEDKITLVLDLDNQQVKLTRTSI